jgi:hypothetical protein
MREREPIRSGGSETLAERETRIDEATLGALACDLRLRPRGAPHFGDLAGALREVRREDGWLVVEYDPAAAPALAALVAAERACCAGIDWRADGAMLWVGAAPEQIDLLERLVRLIDR